MGGGGQDGEEKRTIQNGTTGGAGGLDILFVMIAMEPRYGVFIVCGWKITI